MLSAATKPIWSGLMTTFLNVRVSFRYRLQRAGRLQSGNQNVQRRQLAVTTRACLQTVDVEGEWGVGLVCFTQTTPTDEPRRRRNSLSDEVFVSAPEWTEWRPNAAASSLLIYYDDAYYRSVRPSTQAPRRLLWNYRARSIVGSQSPSPQTPCETAHLYAGITNCCRGPTASQGVRYVWRRTCNLHTDVCSGGIDSMACCVDNNFD